MTYWPDYQILNGNDLVIRSFRQWVVLQVHRISHNRHSTFDSFAFRQFFHSSYGRRLLLKSRNTGGHRPPLQCTRLFRNIFSILLCWNEIAQKVHSGTRLISVGGILFWLATGLRKGFYKRDNSSFFTNRKSSATRTTLSQGGSDDSKKVFKSICQCCSCLSMHDGGTDRLCGEGQR